MPPMCSRAHALSRRPPPALSHCQELGGPAGHRPHVSQLQAEPPETLPAVTPAPSAEPLPHPRSQQSRVLDHTWPRHPGCCVPSGDFECDLPAEAGRQDQFVEVAEAPEATQASFPGPRAGNFPSCSYRTHAAGTLGLVPAGRRGAGSEWSGPSQGSWGRGSWRMTTLDLSSPTRTAVGHGLSGRRRNLPGVFWDRVWKAGTPSGRPSDTTHSHCSPAWRHSRWPGVRPRS